MRSTFNLPGRPQGYPFSDAVQVGNTLYISGRIGFMPGTLEVPESAEDEIRYLMDGLKQVVEHAGWSMDDLVQVTVFTPDVSLFNTFNDIYRTYFKSDPPSRAFLGSGPLLKGARFELVSIAAK